MIRVKDLSIRTKLILLAGSAVFIALVMSSSGIVVNDAAMMRQATIDQLEVQARMMEFNSDGVLAFHEAEAAEDLLQSMSLHPAVEVACLLDASGEVFASYTKTAGAPLNLPARLVPGARAGVDDADIEIVTPVREDGDDSEPLGTLYIRANTHNLAAHMAAQIRYIALVSAGSLLAAMAIIAFLQKAISGPILRLTEAAQVITREEDYSIRVDHDSLDELGTLYSSFNRMLDALKSTHDQVANQAEQLAQEVAVRTQTEADLVVAKDAAEASDRAKSQFLANMSHEIRTPLTGILGFTDVLLAGGDDGDVARRQEYLMTIQASGQHLLGLINDILDLSKIESGRLEFASEACHPDRLVTEVVRVLQVKANEKSLDLDVRWETKIPQIIFTDAARVKQALLNVIGNAIKFTARGGVEIVVRLVSFQGRPHLEFEVRDTGIGVAADKLEKIFDPFVQADNTVTRKFGGTGLGLAISRRIARGLGGELTAASEVGQGSRFTLRIQIGDVSGVPLIEPAAVERIRLAPGAGVDAVHKLPPLDILVVEDGETNRKLIKVLLQRAGARVVTAENGAVGVGRALECRFDLILMDMQMPVLDGYSATRRLRDAGVTLPIIALTAHAMTADRKKCLDAGCTDYLTKPINAEEMFAAIQRTLASSSCAPPQAGPSPAGEELARRSGEPLAERAAPVAAGLPDIATTLPTDDRELATIVAEYIDVLDAKIDEMKDAWDAGRLDDLANLAHWLKGSGGTAGFGVFNQPAQRLEKLAKRSESGDVAAAIAELRALHGRLIVPRLE
jgi:signal transduction histidine kinase/DNA-binding NarL/FixJ family response regulator